jgi:putative sugar O-methyltransferase
VAGYVDASASGSFRGLPVLSPAGLAGQHIDMVVAASPLTRAIRQPFDAVGWNPSRLLSFATDAPECIRLWDAADTPWLAARAVQLADGRVSHAPCYARMEAPAIDDVPSCVAPSVQRDIVARLLRAYLRAAADAPISAPYAVEEKWRVGLRAGRPRFFHAVATQNVEALQELLASFFRNELTLGMFGGREGYDGFVSRGRHVLAELRQQFNIWKNSVSTIDFRRVASPPVGNPYGVSIDGAIVHPNTLMNDYRAEHVLGLVEHVERPIVVDLGGGFGGFGHQLISRRDDVVYVGFDLPENLLVASYFLMSAHPAKRVRIYESSTQPLDPETLRQYDVVLLPNFMLPSVTDRAVDVFVNTVSLSEMEYPTICEYFHQVDRVCRGFLYHENVLDNGDYTEIYPEYTFPELINFKRLSSAPSRWPWFSPTSPAHCHGEFLFVRKDIEQGRYLRSANEPEARLAA